MKAFVAMLALFLAMTMAQAQVQAHNNDNNNDNDNSGNEPAWWFNYPHAYPYTLYYPQYTLHPHPHPHPPMPSPHFSHAQKKCFKAVHDPDLAACKNDYLHFLHTHKPKVSSDCCSALENIGAHCPILKARHPFIGKILKHHCPAPPSPSPSGN